MRAPERTLDATIVDDADEVREVLGRARAFLEGLWFEWKDRTATNFLDRDDDHSEGMCRLSSAFLLAVLAGERPDREWRIVGGVEDDVGFLHDGEWKEHFWVGDGEGRVYDVTASQFGLPKVLVVEPGQPLAASYRGSPRDPAELCRMEVVEDWLREWSEDAPRP